MCYKVFRLYIIRTDIPTDIFRYVKDSTAAIFIAVLLFVLPSKAPGFCRRKSGMYGINTENDNEHFQSTLYVYM